MIVRHTSQAALELITRALIAAAILVGVAVAGLAIRTVLAVRQTHALDADTRVQQDHVRSHTAQPPQVTVLHAKGLEVLRLLQDAVSQGAQRNMCQLAEFRSATQTAPYTPKYRKNMPDDPWAQMDAHFSISGRLRDVMNTLRSLNDVAIPIEVDSVNITRREILKDGSTTVNAQVDLRALAQGAPS